MPEGAVRKSARATRRVSYSELEPRKPRAPTLAQQRALAKAERAGLADVVREQPDRHGGTGLFAVRSLKARELFLPYYGKLMSNDQFLRAYPDQDAVYAMQLPDTRHIDGSKVMGLAARANHSSRPNANFEMGYGVLPVLVNHQPIKAGEEVRVRYHRDYFETSAGRAIDRGFDR